MLYIYSHYRMKLHEFFFFLQAHAGIFFSSSISCMNFFLGSDTPPPRISNGPPLIGTYLVPGVFKQIEFRTFNVNNESSQLPCVFASGKYIWVLNLAPISKLQFVPFV